MIMITLGEYQQQRDDRWQTSPCPTLTPPIGRRINQSNPLMPAVGKSISHRQGWWDVCW